LPILGKFHTISSDYSIKNPPLLREGGTMAISRVMLKMVIYLGLMSPYASSGLPEGRRATLCPLFNLASDGVYIAFPVTRKPVVSYTPFSPLPETGGSFLLHFPVSHLNLTLSGILLYEARTFLSCTWQQRPFTLVPLKSIL